MRRSALVALVCVLPLLTPPLQARIARGSGARHSGSGVLRRRVHISDLITEPGTLEVEWYHTYSITSGAYWIPTQIKITPAEKGFWGSTEFSAGSDDMTNQVQNQSRSTHFGDHLYLNMTTVLHSGQHFSLAVGPQLTVLWRNDSGIRAGAYTITRWDLGRSSLGLTASWTGATQPSPTNPAGTLDGGVGFGRQFGRTGSRHPVTLHTSAIYERSTDFHGFPSFYEGAGIQLSKKVTLDVTASQLGSTDNGYDHQVQAGLIVNFGNPRHWFGR